MYVCIYVRSGYQVINQAIKFTINIISIIIIQI
jgi:hypothetical protein